MSGYEIKVTPEQLRTSLLPKMNDCYILMETLTKNTIAAMRLIQDSVQNSSITNANSKMKTLRKEMTTLLDNISASNQLLNIVADKFEEAVKRLIIENEVIDKYNRHEKINISGYPQTRYGVRSDGVGYYFTYSNGCTWYAFSRWSEVNGKDLVFATHPGNASNWAESIDKTVMNCNSTSDINSIVANAIAVDCAYGNGSGGNHVVYIEAVRDGQVYFSQSDYNNPSIAGQIKVESITKFQEQYEYIITMKK